MLVVAGERVVVNRTMGSVQMGTWFLLGLMQMFWNQIVVMVVEPCEYTKTH